MFIFNVIIMKTKKGARKIFYIIIALLFLGVLIYLILQNKEAEGECSLDEDCVPASCCHPDSCVPKSQTPDCSNMFCTMECKPETMDCGQGECKCIKGKCEAIMK